MVKKLTEGEIIQMVKKIGLEEDKIENENTEMEEEEEEGRSNLFNIP